MKVTKMIVLSLALLMSTSLFAASSGSLSLTAPVQLNGTQLKPGEYKVTWEGNGPDVTVSVMKGREVVATAPAHVKDLDKKFAADAAVLQKNADGSTSLNAVRFSGKKIALEFSGDASAGSKSGTGSN
jgi:hypothetical protein